MSYQVLARKWRPHNFSQVVGQQHVLTALINALDQNRLHHAYLFSGTRGVGKTSIARILAKSLNCEQGVTSTPCGVCHHCQAIDEGRFVDLLEIDAASRTKVEDTRELLDNVQYKPAQGRYKVYLIDEVHMLSKSSFNALLKTLEEPPEYVKFLLATTDPQKLPITILSRCLQFHLKSLSSEAIQQQLAYILDQEQHSYEQGALQALAKAAQGSMRDALSLTDQAIAFGNGVVNYQPVLAMLGTLDHHQVIQLLHFVAAGDAAQCLQKVAELVTLGPDFALVHNELAATLHQVALAHMLPTTLNTLDDGEPIRVLSEQLSPEQVQLYYQIAIKGKQDLPLAPEPRIGLEMTLLRMLAFHPLTTSAKAAQAAVGQTIINPVVTSPLTNTETNPVKLDATAPIAQVMPKVQDNVSPTADNAKTVVETQTETEASQASSVHAAVQPAAQHSEPVSHQDVSHALNSVHAAQVVAAESADKELSPTQPEIAPSHVQPEPTATLGETSHVGFNEPINQTPTQQTQIESPQATGLTGVLEKRNMLRSRKLALESGKAKAKPISASPTANVAANTQTNAPVQQTVPATEQAARTEQVKASQVAPISATSNTRPSVNPIANSSANTSANTSANQSGQSSAEVDLPWATDMDEPRKANVPMQGVPNEPAPAVTVEQGPPDYGDLPPIEAYDNDYAQYFETPDYSFNHDLGSDFDGSNFDDSASGYSDSMPASNLEPRADATCGDVELKPVGNIDERANPETNLGYQDAAPSNEMNKPSVEPQVEPNASSSSKSALAAMTEFEIPSGFSPQNNDPWCKLIDNMALGGILRQLALNSVLLDSNLAQAQQLKLLLKPTSAHLDNDKNHQQLLQAVQQILPQIQEIEIQIGQDPNLATPVEIEQQIYLARLAQAKIDIQQDEAVNFFIARFGATVDEASIKPK